MPNIADYIFIFGAKYLFLIVIAIFFTWFLTLAGQKKKEVLIVASISGLLALVIFKLAGHFYYNPRPFVVGNFIPLFYHPGDNGFPSHHTLLVSFLATIVFVFNRRVGFMLWILALCVGISRVYVGVHHVVDIMGSILISIVSIILVIKTGGRFGSFLGKQ